MATTDTSNSKTPISNAMAKKSERYSGETLPQNNPFAILASPQSTPISTTTPAPTKAEKLPKPKSTRLERAHRGGKTVTIVAFHGSPSDDAKKLWLSTAKKALGIGGTVEGDCVVLQGDQSQRINDVK